MAKVFARMVGGSALFVLMSAAPSGAETRAGVFGGAALFKWHISPSQQGASFGSRTGFSEGAVLDFRFGTRFGVRLEPGYVEKGSDSTLEPDGFFDGGTGEFKLDYVELPLLFTASIGSGGVRPYLVAGPSAAYRASARAQAMGKSEDLDEDIKRWDFGIVAGAGLEIGSGRTRGFVEARYGWGLTNTPEQVEEGDATLKNRGTQVIAGVTFALGR